MTVRRSGLGRVLIVALTGVIAFSWAAAPAAADPDDEIGKIEEEIEKEADELEGIVEDYNAISEDLAKTKSKIKKLEKKLAPYEEELDELYDSTEGLATAAYKQQGLSEMSAFLNAGTPERFVDRITLLDGVSASTAEIIGKIVDKKAKYDEDLAVLEDLRVDLAESEELLQEKKDTITEGIEGLQKDRKDAFGPDAGYVPDYIPGDRGKIVSQAMAQRGKPYVWAASGPGGYDCSGLILDAYRQLGINLPHNAAAQYNMSMHISRDQLQPGDAVFYNGLQHVAMYIGDGYVVHAPTFGDVVKVEPLDQAATPYYGAGRFI
ncbi:NlpC/P60 family protein [Stackebrandtia soli]|uniref:C40 family peptidase n=1 Tax=Stackebrandtia soli TaxID=1892856 RepID=UPI0039E82B00